jgi:hypothetical protein
MPVAHTYNPSYSGDSDQKDHQPRQMVHKTLSGKNPSQKRAGGVAQGVGPKFKPQYHQKKKKGQALSLVNPLKLTLILKYIVYSKTLIFYDIKFQLYELLPSPNS